MQTLTQAPVNWTPLKKLIFRCCFLYFAVYIFFTPNNEVPLINLFYEGLNNLLHQFIPWWARNVFRYKESITVFTNGSGDTTYDYVLWYFGILLTLAGTLIWTLFDRKRPSYNSLYYWLRVILRYYLFYTMITYGMFKVIKLQFPYPGLSRLTQPYGDSSPMGLAWTYMGYSTTYNYFTGIAELLGGLLLLSRRTTTLGALVCLGVMTNVFMINMGYDVPVKLLSFNTILMSLFLLRTDAKRLVNFFLRNQPAPSAHIGLPYTNRKLKIGLLIVKGLFIVTIIGLNLSSVLQAEYKYGDKKPKPPLYGIYYTESFVRNGDTLPPLQTDTSRWKRVIIASPVFASIQLMNDSVQWYNLTVDTAAKTAMVNPVSDTTAKTAFMYIKDTSGLTLAGKIKTDQVRIRLKRYDEHRFRLVNRGFHWVNEYPFNR